MAGITSLQQIEKAWLSRFHRWKGYAISLTGSVTDAEEVVQEAVTRTLRARPRFETERDAHNYMLTAVRTSALQMFERRRRRVAFAEPMPPVDPAEIVSDPLRIALTQESRRSERRLMRSVLAALEDLTSVQREAIELLVLRDPPMKLREVAAIQDAPVSTVHSRLQAALRRLGRSLADHE